VFPLWPSKSPATPRAFNDATTDEATIAAWWKRNPDALIGCRIPEGVILLDLDVEHGSGNGVATMDRLEAQHGLLPRTRQHASGRGDGGHHLWFNDPGGRISTDRLPGVDLLHHGWRHTVLPPSAWHAYDKGQPAEHKNNGQPYEWHGTGLDCPIADCPQWLIDILRDPEPVISQQKPTSSQSARNGDGFIGRYKADHSIEQILTDHDWIEVRPGDWCHPKATSSRSADIRNGRLYVYTPTPGLPVTRYRYPQGMDAHDLFTWFEHRGDQAAAKAAAKAMYPLERSTRPEPVVNPETGELVTVTERDEPVLDAELDEPFENGPTPPELPDALWSQRPWLERIYTAAQASQVGPDALLLATLARICVATDYRFVLPALIGAEASLNLQGVIVGSPGAGKGAAIAASRSLVGQLHTSADYRTREVPAGSGEGMAAAFYGEVADPDKTDKII
jgi:hypothetical protein